MLHLHEVQRLQQRGALPRLAGRLVDGPRLVVVNGAVDHERSVLPALDGLIVSDLAAAPADATRLHTERSDTEVSDAYMALELAYGVDRAFVDVDVASPDGIKQLRAGEHTARRLHHVLEQPELGW